MLFTYNPKEQTFAFGAIVLSGFAEGSMITFEAAEDSFTTVVGADGDVTRSLNANATGVFTATLKASSPSNDLLSALHNADRINGGGVRTAIMKDNSGTTTIAAAKAWIRRWPTVDKAKEITDVAWMFDVEKAVVNIGGNTAE